MVRAARRRADHTPPRARHRLTVLLLCLLPPLLGLPAQAEPAADLERPVGALVYLPLTLSASPGTVARARLPVAWQGQAPLTGVQVLPSDLVSPTGGIISSTLVHPDMIWFLPPRPQMPLWQSLFYVLGMEPAVSVEVPRPTPPGRYQGTLTLSAGSREYDIPLAVTVGRGSAEGVLLIDGALNQTDYTDLRRALREAGYPSNRVVEWRNLRAGLNSTATENATALLAALKRLGWRPEDRVDVVAHSFGGLVARRMAQINAQPGRQVVTLRNIITCGTPLGGHNGADVGAWAKLSVGKLRLLGEQLRTLRELGADHLRPSDFADVTAKSPEGYPRYWLLGGTDPSRMILPWSQVPVDLGEFEPLPHDSVVSTRSVAGYTPRRQWVNRSYRPSLEPVVRQSCDRDTDSPRAIRFLCLRHEELVMDLRERRYPWRNPVRDLIVPLILGSDWRPCDEPVSLTGPVSLPYNQSGGDARAPARPSGTPGILDRAAAAAKARLRSVTRSLAESGRRRLLPLASGAIRALGLGGAPDVRAR